MTISNNQFVSAAFVEKFIRTCNECELVGAFPSMDWNDLYNDENATERYTVKLFHRAGGTFAEVTYNGRAKAHKLNADIYAGTGWKDLVDTYLPRGREVATFALAISGPMVDPKTAVFATSSRRHEIVFDAETMKKGSVSPLEVFTLCGELRHALTPSKRDRVREERRLTSIQAEHERNMEIVAGYKSSKK